MHALLQPAWMTREMCRDVLESHLAGLGRTARQPLTSPGWGNRLEPDER